jgi:hypothetical protein
MTPSESFENVANFKYFGMAVANQIALHSAENLLPALPLSENLKIKIYKTIVFSTVLYRCGTWSFTIREEHE